MNKPRWRPAHTIGILLAVATCIVGCKSVTDPLNANGRAEKMQKALAAQRKNAMATAPKSNPQQSPP